MTALGRLLRDRRGSPVVEFALVLAPMMTLLMGGVEAGNVAYSRSILEGTLRVAARMATTGTFSTSDIDGYVRARLAAIGVPASDVTIVRKAYKSFESVESPEPLTSDVAPLGGAPSSGDCYLDLNGDNHWSADAGSAGDGQSEDILYYGVKIRYPLLFGFMASEFGGVDGALTLSANTVVKNEPYGDARQPAAEKCIA